MKVLAISASPRKKGNTIHLLTSLLEHLEGHFESELIYLRDMDIEPCRECYSCMDKGVCVIDDDMQTLYQKLKESNVLILGSPVFMGGLASRMRIFYGTDMAFEKRYTAK